MALRTIFRLAILALCLSFAPGCGVKGDPVPYTSLNHDAAPTPTPSPIPAPTVAPESGKKP